MLVYDLHKTMKNCQISSQDLRSSQFLQFFFFFCLGHQSSQARPSPLFMSGEQNFIIIYLFIYLLVVFRLSRQAVMLGGMVVKIMSSAACRYFVLGAERARHGPVCVNRAGDVILKQLHV